MAGKRGKATPKHKRSKSGKKAKKPERSGRSVSKRSAKHKGSGHAKKHKKPAKHKKKRASAGKRKEKPKLEEKIRPPPHELEEEFFVPSPVHRGSYRIPLGVKFLIGYLIFLAILYVISFISGITFPTTILFGQLMTGTRALVINSVLLIIILAVIYGLWKRRAYTFDLAIGFFAFTALNAVVSLMMFDSADHPIFKKLMLLSFVSLVFMNIVIIWYILHEKKYFYSERFRDRPVHHRDKLFLYIMVAFWTIALLVGGTLGVSFYKDTKRLIDEAITDIHGDYYRGQMVCESKQGPERDVCTLVVATAMSQKQRPYGELAGLCADIRSDFYRFTCMKSISG